MGKKNIVILHALSDGPTAFATSFKAEVERLGGKILLMEAHAGEDKDFTGVLTKIAPLKPDAVLLSTWYTPAALLAMQAQEMNLHFQFIGMDATYSPDLITLGKDAVEGIVIGAFFHSDLDNAEAKKYVESFKQKYNGESPEAYGAGSYDAINIIAESMRKGGTDRESIREYMETIGGLNPPWPGVTGSTKFDEKHDVIKPLVFVTVKNGEFKLAEIQ
jgi:branched-chain amino acid transport system substrate-binding protein